MIDQVIINTIDELLKSVEASIVPKGSATSFSDGDEALIDYVEHGELDKLNYYNSLIKQKLYVYGVTAAIISSPTKKEMPIQPPNSNLTGNVLDVLDIDEFVDQGYENPVVGLDQEYTYYCIEQGDTLQSIAQDFYEDYRQWTRIAQANQLQENDLIDADMVGSYIKIPVSQAGSLVRSNQNLVYESMYDPENVSSIERYLFGTDFDVGNEKIESSSKGDLKKISGIKNVSQNIKNRFRAGKGSLNPLHPDWGISLMNDMAQTPWVIGLERQIADMEIQAMHDPRVVSSTIDRGKLELAGDRIDIEIEIELHGGFLTTWKTEIT